MIFLTDERLFKKEGEECQCPRAMDYLCIGKEFFRPCPTFQYCFSFESWKLSIWILCVQKKHNDTITIRVTMAEKYLTVNILQGKTDGDKKWRSDHC